MILSAKLLIGQQFLENQYKHGSSVKWEHKSEYDLPVPLMDHTVAVYPQITDQVCHGQIRAITMQNTIFVYGGKMTASGTMECEDGSGASESNDFPMVLKAGLPF